MPASPNGPLSELAPRFSLSAGLMGEAPVHPEAPRQTQALWFLSGQTSEGEAVRHVPIYSFPFRVGRRADVSLSLAYRTVSSVHAELVRKRLGPRAPRLGKHQRHLCERCPCDRRASLGPERPRAVRRSAVPGPSPVVGNGRYDRRDARLRLCARTCAIRSVDESPLGDSVLSARRRLDEPVRRSDTRLWAEAPFTASRCPTPCSRRPRNSICKSN